MNQNYSKASKKRWTDPKFKKRVGRAISNGWSIESRKKKSLELRRRWKSGRYRRRMAKLHSKEMKKRWRNQRDYYLEVARRNRTMPSKGSRRLKSLLGTGWKLEYRISIGQGSPGHAPNYRVDLAFPELKIIIEVDGKYHEGIIQRREDLRREKDLKRLGWTVFRVSEIGCRRLPKKMAA